MRKARCKWVDLKRALQCAAAVWIDASSKELVGPIWSNDTWGDTSHINLEDFKPLFSDIEAIQNHISCAI